MTTPQLVDLRLELLASLRERSFSRRRVTLASGRVSDFYIDCKNVTLEARGHVLVGRLLFEELLGFERRHGLKVTGVGGLTLGADPIASAVAMTSSLEGHPVPAFIVRKEAKSHGSQAYLEGMSNVADGGVLVVVEDVVTTGGSALTAVQRLRDAGYRVPVVLGLVDRLEGGREVIEAEGLELVTLFDRRDFIPDVAPTPMPEA